MRGISDSLHTCTPAHLHTCTPAHLAALGREEPGAEAGGEKEGLVCVSGGEGEAGEDRQLDPANQGLQGATEGDLILLMLSVCLNHSFHINKRFPMVKFIVFSL